jgi:hypothetical protein
MTVFWINRIAPNFLHLFFYDSNGFRTRRVGLEVYCKLKIHGNGNGNISCAPLLPVNLGSLPRIAQCHDLRALPEQRLRCFFSPVLRCLVVPVSSKYVGNVIGPCCTNVAINC